MLKKMNFKRGKGQSTLEYAILIIIIAAALLSMQAYIKRGISGRMKQSADDIGGQFSPGNTKVNKVVTKSSTVHETFINGQATTDTGNEKTNTTDTTTILDTTKEDWGSGLNKATNSTK
ncbi:MAG: hypothetical protein HQL26_10375 [Candidatus Omnitrophica bacterium]|nr:hypothetical protein [Candidatus Omnitrophota bacterium]